MINLLKETIEFIAHTGHAPSDIAFIGSELSGYACSWEEFRLLADQEYDDGYGSAEVASDLIIVFKDGGRMTRGEYDGSEWWQYMATFVMPAEQKRIKQLFVGPGFWGSLKDIHEKLNARA